MTPRDTIGPDGSRNEEQWKNTLAEGLGVLRMQIVDAFNPQYDFEHRRRALATVAKEARRLESDVYRIGHDLWGLTNEQVNAIALWRHKTCAALTGGLWIADTQKTVYCSTCEEHFPRKEFEYPDGTPLYPTIRKPPWNPEDLA